MTVSSPSASKGSLLPGASDETLIVAAAANHTAWFAANAEASGGVVGETDGVRWTVAGKQMTVAFPQIEAEKAGAILDVIVGEAFARGLTGASCWALTPTQPPDLGAQVAARGFEWGWRPHWMVLELREETTAFSVPDGVRIELDETGGWDADGLPYYDRNEDWYPALQKASPRRTWRFVARRDGQVVGQCVVFVTDGPLGVAGIYSVGVLDVERGKGIGRAVSLAACRFAWEQGCHYALLNSAADFLYSRIGFRSLGYGQTWWMHRATLAAPPPTPGQVAFAEAVGQGDIDRLNGLPQDALPDDWNAPTQNGMTPVALATRAGRPASVDWLASRGAQADLLDFWDLGQEADVRALLAARPGLVNRRVGIDELTPLHQAVWRDDAALVRILLDACPNLSLKDASYYSTPLGWARHLRRAEIAALLEAYEAGQD